MKCHSCGKSIPGTFPYCDYCGAWIATGNQFSGTLGVSGYAHAARRFLRRISLPTSSQSSQVSEGIFPWPSLGWQQVGLILSILIGIMLIGAGLGSLTSPSMSGEVEAGVLVALVGIGLLTMSGYAAIKTSWLRYVERRNLPVRIAGGTSVAVGLGSGAVIVVAVLIAMVIAVLAFIAIFWALLKALEEASKRD